MWIKTLQVENYKSILDSGELRFGKGINLIVGKNNSGKSALLDCLKLQLEKSLPHASTKTLPDKETSLDHRTTLTIGLSLYGWELVRGSLGRALAVTEETAIQIAWPSEYVIGNNVPEADVKEFLEAEHIYKLREVYGPGGRASSDLTGRKDDCVWGEVPVGYGSNIQVRGRNSYVKHTTDSSTTTGNSIFSSELEYIQCLIRDVAKLNAERFNLAKSSSTESKELRPDASNLASAIQGLKNEKLADFEEFIRRIKIVYPEIADVTVAMDNGLQEIRIWFEGEGNHRKELSQSLEQCGSGVGQVLAILRMSMEVTPRILLMDEPTSFLYPGAAKRLLQLFQSKDFERFQIFITTHSPELIRHANASTITYAEIKDRQSVFKQMANDEIEELKACLLALGTSLTDFYGADQVLWVEGPTEEAILEEIRNSEYGAFLSGVNVIHVKNTGDFEQRSETRRNSCINAHKRMAENNCLLNIRTQFFFDRENKSDAQIEDRKREMGSKIELEYTKRSMLENYLLDPEEVAAILRKESINVNAEDIAQEFLRLRNGADEENWKKTADGAAVLKDVFGKYHVQYQKIRFGRQIAKAMLGKGADDILAFVNEVQEFLKPRVELIN